MNWNQPQCERCWVDTHTDDDGNLRVPVRLSFVGDDPDVCAWCGYPTWAGIYVRADPSTVAFPS
jgi:hypothetical protein